MTRALAIVGFIGAVMLALLAATLLATPNGAAVPAAIEQTAPARLALPDDPTIRARPAPVTLAGGTRIRVPRLRIDLAIEPGVSARDVEAQATPTNAAFLLPGSAVPGAPGNSYVYAHARPGLFLALWDVRLGDAIEIREPSGGVLGYVVTEIHPHVSPEDLTYITPTDEERLTLQTSTGSWTLSPRFVVVARPAR
jgi:hypothetical protein